MKPPSLTTTCPSPRHTRLAALLRGGVGLGALLVALPLHAVAGPQDGTVVRGTATIAPETGGVTTVTQTSSRAVIDWSSFSLGTNESLIFKQPSASSVTLNRVTAGPGSVISGNVTANGRVFLLDPRGVLVTQGAVLDVNSLVLTTAAIDNDAFMAGDYRFTGADARPSAGITNQGTILADPTGFVALVGTSVDNQGTITAQLGTVALGAAPGFTLDFAGDGLISFDVTGALSSSSLVSLPNALIANSGTIQANGGTVRMSVAQASRLLNNAISLGGAVEATSVSTRAGAIVLEASAGDIAVTGRATALGDNVGERGGTIRVQAENVRVADGGVLNASGDNGGGTIRIGSAITPVQTIDTATNAILRADATRAGAGGTVALAASGTLSHAGQISAVGIGPTIGRGGTVTMAAGTKATVEGQVNAQGHAGTTAGSWSLTTGGDLLLAAAPDLLQPDLSYVATSTVQTALNNVTSVSLAGAGNLTVNSAIVRTLGTTTLLPGLDLKAGGNVTLATGASLRGTTARGIHVSMTANSDAVTGDQDVTAGNVTVNGAISTFGGRFASSGVDFSNGAAINTNSGTIDIRHSRLVSIGTGLSTAGSSGANLTVAAGQGIRLGAGLATSNGTIGLTGPVSLLTDTTLSAGAGNIRVDGSIDGARSLTLNATGSTILTGAVGGTTALTSLTANGGVSFTAGSVRTTGAQSYADSSINLSGTYTTNVAAFTASGTVNVASGTVISTNSGPLTLGPVRGTGSLRLVNLFGALTLSGVDGLSSLDISSQTPVILSGGTYALSGDATFSFASTQLTGDILFGTAADLGSASLVGKTSLTGSGVTVRVTAITGSDHDLGLSGSINVAGGIAVRDLVTTGTVSVGGDVGGRDLSLSGATRIAGGVTARNIALSGPGSAISIGGSIAADALSSSIDTQSLTVGGDVKIANGLSLAGTVRITGSVTAAVATLYGPGTAISIGGSISADTLSSSTDSLSFVLEGDARIAGKLFLAPATRLSAQGTWAIGNDATFGTVALAGDLTVNGGGNIAFAGPVDGTSDGNQNLTVTGVGAVRFDQAVGAITRLARADLTGKSLSLGGLYTRASQTLAGDTTLAGTYSSSGGGFTAKGPVTLSAVTTLTMRQNIEFQQALNGPGALEANTKGDVQIAGPVGTTTALGGLSVTADGTVWFKKDIRAAGLMATAGDGITLGDGAAIQVHTPNGAEFTGNVVLGADTTINGSANRFDGSVTAAATGVQGLLVNGAASFTGPVGGSGLALEYLAVTGKSRFAAAVTTVGDQSFAMTDLGGPVAFTSRQGSIRFSAAVDGSGALAVGAAKDATFDGRVTVASATAQGRTITAVGMTTTGNQLLTADTLKMSGTYVSSGGDVTWTGAQELSGAVSLSARNISLNGPVEAGTADTMLKATAANDLVMAGGIGATKPLSSLELSARSLLLGTGTGTAFRTAGGQTATGTIRLASDLLLAAGGDIRLNGTVDSQAGAARSLVINSPGITSITGTVGGQQSLARLVTDAKAGSIAGLTVTAADAALAGGFTRLGPGGQDSVIRVETSQEQSHGDTLELAADTTLNSRGKLSFAGPVRGDGVPGRDLEVNSVGDTEFTAGVANLASLSTDKALTSGVLRINGATDVGTQSFGETTATLAGSFSGNRFEVKGDSLIAGPTTITMASDTVSFRKTINAENASINSMLTITTGNATTPRGTVNLDGAIGDRTKLSGLAVTGGTVNAVAAIQTAGDLAITGTAVNLGGTLYASDRSLSLSGRVNLQASAVSLSAGGGDLRLNGTVDGAAALTLARTVNTGRAILGGTIGAVTALTSLTTTADLQTDINTSSIRTTGNQTWGGGVALGQTTTLSAASLSFAQNVWSAATQPAGLTINGSTTVTTNGSNSVTFRGDVGVSPFTASSGALGSLTVNGLSTLLAPRISTQIQTIRTVRTATTAPGGVDDLDGRQSYAGTVTLSAAGAVFDTTGRWQPGASTDTLSALFSPTGPNLVGGNLLFNGMTGGPTVWLLGNGKVRSAAGTAALPQIDVASLTVAGQGGEAQIEGTLLLPNTSNKLTGEIAAQAVKKIGRRSNDYRLNDCAMGNPTCIVVSYSAPPVPETVSIPAFPVAERVIRFDPTGVIRGNEDLWPDRNSDDDKKGDAQ